MTVKQLILCLMVVSFPMQAMHQKLRDFYQAAHRGEIEVCKQMLRDNAELYDRVVATGGMQASIHVASICYDLELEKSELEQKNIFDDFSSDDES